MSGIFLVFYTGETRDVDLGGGDFYGAMGYFLGYRLFEFQIWSREVAF